MVSVNNVMDVKKCMMTNAPRELLLSTCCMQNHKR